MTKNNSLTYKSLYFILAIIPQVAAILFGYSIPLHIFAFLRGSFEDTRVFLIALIIIFLWLVLLFALKFFGILARLGVQLEHFKNDVFYVFGYSSLIGLFFGAIIAFLR